MKKFNMKNLELAREMLSPPGDTLQETIDEFGMSQNELAERMGRPIKTINEIINGKEVITPNTAIQLERVLNIKAEFWLERERRFRQSLAEIEYQESLQKWEPWLLNFPISQMIKLGWLSMQSSKLYMVKELLTFFAVASPDEWKSVYIGEKINAPYYRISLSHVTEQGALSAWLRKGELQAKELVLRPYDRKAFFDNLKRIRTLAFEHPLSFKEQLQDICSLSGVAIVFTPCLPKTNVSGVARWINFNNNPLIQLSGRYKSNDHFWFTFFHESAHILKHGKKAFFIEGIEGIELSYEKEKEANEFASNILIPPKPFKDFVNQADFSAPAIRLFANHIGMHPGIIAGRLCHEKYIDFAFAQKFKLKVDIL